MLSVSGARGIVGESMTPAVAADLARAFAELTKKRIRQPRPAFCLGRDSRPSSPMLARAVAEGLAAAGCDVIDLGVAATPTVSVMIGELGAAGGFVVTASHNPPEWNGLKCLAADGMAPGPQDVEAIARRFRERSSAAAEGSAVCREAHGDRTHTERVLAHVDPEAIRAAGFTVVLDSINGAGGGVGRLLLERLGCTLIHLHGEPTGDFAHDPEPTEANLVELARETARRGAAVGFGQDPDADRLAVVDETGRYIGEEYTVVLAAKQLLDQRGGTAIVVNLSTSRLIDDLAAGYAGARVLRTPVGEAHVAEAMRRAGAVIGGEGNGGVIFPPVCWVRDSLSAMALVLGLLAARKSPLSAIVGSLPRYTMLKRKLDLEGIGGPEALPAALAKVTEAARGRTDTTDGVRIDYDEGWVHLRPSNTEPIVRIIAEAKTQKRAGELISSVLAAAGWG